MTTPHHTSLFSHLALALSGMALTAAELDFLPEMPYLLVVYLALLLLSWQMAGRWTLPTWAANLLGLLIAGGASVWIAARMGDSEATLWLREVPIAVAIVPYLGPVLMLLLLVRLYRPRSVSDFTVVQGLGLVQVALGCVLTSGTLFGLFLLAYLVVAMCALAAHERLRQQARSAPGVDTVADAGQGWLGFCLRWTVSVGVLTLPLFLFTPRAEGPEWDPWSRFGLQPTQPTRARTGFSDEIDLNRSGTLEMDERVAFTVTVTDVRGEPIQTLPGDQRWRGVVLDRYEDGIWRSGLNWTSRLPVYRPLQNLGDPADTMLLEFRVPGKTGGLFLAEPAFPGEEFGTLPVWMPGTRRDRQPPLFFEVEGTIVPQSYLTRNEYRYTQILSRTMPPDRYVSRRSRDIYFQRLLRVRPAELEPWTRDLLLRLVKRAGPRQTALRLALQAHAENGDPIPPIYWKTIAEMLRDYLAYSREFSYSLEFQRQDTSLDPVMDFLVNIRQGACERFASALALMLRSQGVPTRIIKGYRGVEAVGEGVYQVKEAFAHAWVEVLVLAEGSKELNFDWLILDPTPDGESATRTGSGLSRWRQLQQSGQALWQDLIVGYNASQQADLWQDLFSVPRWVNVLPWGVAGLCLMLAIGLVRRRRRQRRQQQGREGAAALYADLVALLTQRLHLAPGAGETPRELAERAAATVAAQPKAAAFAEVPLRLVRMYYTARYGGVPPTREQLTDGWAELAALDAALRE